MLDLLKNTLQKHTVRLRACWLQGAVAHSFSTLEVLLFGHLSAN